MPRNKKLELDNIAPGKWLTADGRFGVFRRFKAINPMEVTSDFKVGKEYSIHSFEEYNGPREYLELAPEVGRVENYREIFPWLGQHTGEGSFELGDPDRVTAKPMGARRVEEAMIVLTDVFDGRNTEKSKQVEERVKEVFKLRKRLL